MLFALATVICSLGSGNMAQSNSMASALAANYNVPEWISGLIFSTLIFLVIVGGIKRIATVTSKLVPFMAFFYIIAGLIVIIINISEVGNALLLIFKSAFSSTAATGGFIGATIAQTAKWGIARGLFSNEAGQGSAAIAHAAAKTDKPIREGLIASLGPFIDTLIICTLTAFVIIFTNQWQSGIKGANMTVNAFSNGLDVIGIGFLGTHIVSIGLALFALSTAISWSYYGDRACEFLFGEKAKPAARTHKEIQNKSPFKFIFLSLKRKIALLIANNAIKVINIFIIQNILLPHKSF